MSRHPDGQNPFRIATTGSRDEGAAGEHRNGEQSVLPIAPVVTADRMPIAGTIGITAEH